MVWNEGGDETLWREICDEVRHDAERLFKLIGEAHAVLSDQIKVPRRFECLLLSLSSSVIPLLMQAVFFFTAEPLRQA